MYCCQKCQLHRTTIHDPDSKSSSIFHGHMHMYYVLERSSSIVCIIYNSSHIKNSNNTGKFISLLNCLQQLLGTTLYVVQEDGKLIFPHKYGKTFPSPRTQIFINFSNINYFHCILSFSLFTQYKLSPGILLYVTDIP